MRASLWLVLALVAGCSQEELLSVVASSEGQVVARHYIGLLRTRRFDEIERATDVRIRSQLRDALERMADVLPEGVPTSTKLVGAHKL